MTCKMKIGLLKSTILPYHVGMTVAFLLLLLMLGSHPHYSNYYYYCSDAFLISPAPFPLCSHYHGNTATTKSSCLFMFDWMNPNKKKQDNKDDDSGGNSKKDNNEGLQGMFENMFQSKEETDEKEKESKKEVVKVESNAVEAAAAQKVEKEEEVLQADNKADAVVDEIQIADRKEEEAETTTLSSSSSSSLEVEKDEEDDKTMVAAAVKPDGDDDDDDNDDDSSKKRKKIDAYIDDAIKTKSRINGVVQWYNGRRGFGFIEPFKTTEEEEAIKNSLKWRTTATAKGVFVHHSQISAPDENYFRKLYMRETVNFEIVVDEKNNNRILASDVTGPNGTNVRYVRKQLEDRKKQEQQ